MKFFAPPTEFLASYNTGKPLIREMGQTWFAFKNNDAITRFNDQKVNVLNFYPILAGICSVLFLFGFICFIVLGGVHEEGKLSRSLLLVATLWLANFGFSVLASPIALRFQLFPIIVSLCFSIMMLEYIFRKAFGVIGNVSSESVEAARVAVS